MTLQTYVTFALPIIVLLIGVGALILNTVLLHFDKKADEKKANDKARQLAEAERRNTEERERKAAEQQQQSSSKPVVVFRRRDDEAA